MTDTTVSATKTATKTFEDAITKGKTDMEGVLKAQQEQLEKTTSQLMKSYDELTALTKGNVDAVVTSGTIVAKGAEEAGRHVAAFTQNSFEKGIAASKAMMGVKTVQELVTLQQGFARSSVDALVDEMTKLQELSFKVTTEAMAPLNARFNLAVETLSKPLNA